MFCCSMRVRYLLSVLVLLPGWCALSMAQPVPRGGAAAVPRTPDGKPNLQGIWQAPSTAAYDLLDHAAKQGMPAGTGVVEGGAIPYQSWAAAKKAENFTHRQTADPMSKCYLPGVPRIMYLDFPFQIFQTASQVAIAFEWSQKSRTI